VGVDCYGWVEVHNPTDIRGVRFGDWWSGVIRINDIVDRNYRAYGYFFDAVNHVDSPLAGHRGVPSQMSHEALADAAAFADDPTELTGVTWILWSEIQASDWRTISDLGALGWELLFTLMADLAAVYGGDHVRLVIWFDPDTRV
jgi:hypothetical protein